MMDYYEPHLAIHEAGHVIARMIYLYGIAGQVDFIKISIDEDHGGTVNANPMFTDEELRNFNLESYPDLEFTRRQLMKEAVINVGGVAAECVLNNRPLPDLTKSKEDDIASDLTKFQIYCRKILKTQGIDASSPSFFIDMKKLNLKLFQAALGIFKTEKCKTATLFLVESLESEKVFTGSKLRVIVEEIRRLLN
jgi:hypothetical protein